MLCPDLQAFDAVLKDFASSLDNKSIRPWLIETRGVMVYQITGFH
jgi:hypothetical protein